MTATPALCTMTANPVLCEAHGEKACDLGMKLAKRGLIVSHRWALADHGFLPYEDDDRLLATQLGREVPDIASVVKCGRPSRSQLNIVVPHGRVPVQVIGHAVTNAGEPRMCACRVRVHDPVTALVECARAVRRMGGPVEVINLVAAAIDHGRRLSIGGEPLSSQPGDRKKIDLVDVLETVREVPQRTVANRLAWFIRKAITWQCIALEHQRPLELAIRAIDLAGLPWEAGVRADPTYRRRYAYFEAHTSIWIPYRSSPNALLGCGDGRD